MLGFTENSSPEILITLTLSSVAIASAAPSALAAATWEYMQQHKCTQRWIFPHGWNWWQWPISVPWKNFSADGSLDNRWHKLSNINHRNFGWNLNCSWKGITTSFLHNFVLIGMANWSGVWLFAPTHNHIWIFAHWLHFQDLSNKPFTVHLHAWMQFPIFRK